MPRKKRNFNREIPADIKFGSVTLSKFINHLMLDGKKSVASNIVYQALEGIDKVAKEKKVSSLDLFLMVIENLKPKIKMKSRRVGGSTYQVPMPLREKESEMMAMRWLIDATRSSKGKAMHESLRNTIIDTLENRGNAYKKKEEMHKSAEANKAFAHFA